MNNITLPPLRIGNLIAKVPIIQGGMGVGVSLSGLASAVAEEGGVGVIACAGIGMYEKDFNRRFREANARALKREICKAKAKTNGLIGVNIMVALSDYELLTLTAIEAEADFVFMGAGLPLKIPQLVTPERLRSCRTRIVPIISSARAAELICRSWLKSGCIPDAFVVEGPMAGGHIGFKKQQIESSDFELDRLLKDVIATLKPFEESTGKPISVIAAGGIFNGEDIHRFLQMGASGVQMATRFVTTHECDAHINFKKAYIEAGPDDLTIIDSPVGLPGRALISDFLRDVSKGIKKPFSCSWKCLRTCDFRNAPYCIAKALTQAKLGNLDKGFVFAGANAWRLNQIISVKELMETLFTEYKNALKSELVPELAVS